jgi:catechol 2,3-dioxygenase-like lactoylglutathione lyase family enzyme
MARLVLVILAVDDATRAAAFYRAAFGWRARVELPHYVELEGGGVRVGLYRRDGYARNTGAAPAAPREWGDDAAYLADPDGHVIAIARPR